MFFCEECRVKKGWPKGYGPGSRGPCEVCKKTANCHDVPSKALPLPPSPPKESPKNPTGIKSIYSMIWDLWAGKWWGNE